MKRNSYVVCIRHIDQPYYKGWFGDFLKFSSRAFSAPAALTNRTTPKHDQHQNLLVPQRQSPSSSSACSSVSQRASGPVYDNIPNLAMTSEPSGAAPTDGLDDVQYSTVHFTRSQMKEVPLYSSVQPKAAPQEEEVQYAAVNVKSKSRRAQ